jgi:predicted peptidase
MPIREALTLHGPLAPGASGVADSFIIVAPQLPLRGDFWYKHAGKVRRIVEQVQAQYQGDPERTFLTGFSFGGNGVLDLALVHREFWTALWPVDPTRVPATGPQCPIWFSSGEISRRNAPAFMRRLDLEPLQSGVEPRDRVYEDQNQDHVGTARLAYRNDDIYRWLLSREKE